MVSSPSPHIELVYSGTDKYTVGVTNTQPKTVVVYHVVGGSYALVGSTWKMDELEKRAPVEVMRRVRELMVEQGVRPLSQGKQEQRDHCFYCGARIIKDACPGCGALDWDRE